MGADGATQVAASVRRGGLFSAVAGRLAGGPLLGRYWTILSISLFYCLGHGTLAMFEGSRAGLFAGLALLAIGAGGIKPCVSAFVGDQFGPNQDRALTRVYGWFYWAVNLGAAFGFFVIPIMRNKAGYSWALACRGFSWVWPR